MPLFPRSSVEEEAESKYEVSNQPSIPITYPITAWNRMNNLQTIRLNSDVGISANISPEITC